MAENIDWEKLFKAANEAGFNMAQFEKVLSVFSPEQIASANPEDLNSVLFFLDLYLAKKICAFMRIWLGTKKQRGFWEIVWQLTRVNINLRPKLECISPDKLDRWKWDELVNVCGGGLWPYEAMNILVLYDKWKEGKLV